MTSSLYFQIAICGGLSLLLTAGATVLLRSPIEVDAVPSKQMEVQISRVAVQHELPPNITTDIAAIRARPLFSKSRRPYDPPAPPITETQPQLVATTQFIAAESLMLKGIFLQPPVSRALIVSPANPQGIWVTGGGEIEGWEIKEITASTVRLLQQQQVAVLTLYKTE